jgi:hypothetical protein
MTKVHFAGSDNAPPRITALKAAGVQYRLFTCYPFVAGKKQGDDMRVSGLHETRPGLYRHVIMDSGLFTLMFGAQSGAVQDEATIAAWQDRIIEFVTANDVHASIVECDCQKIVSPEYAWELRADLRARLPDREIINVFHLEDGKGGFERLAEFSDYLAISVPELRIAQPRKYRQTVSALTRMAKRIKPGIKIHLLGCTELGLLRQNDFCDSADSSSWLSPLRYGYLKSNHIKNLRKDVASERMELCGSVALGLGFDLSDKAVADASKASVCASYSKQQYERAAGKQD